MREEQLTSVVVPVYNSEATIEACIRSILGQTESRLELIVIDDAAPTAAATSATGWPGRMHA